MIRILAQPIGAIVPGLAAGVAMTASGQTPDAQSQGSTLAGRMLGSSRSIRRRRLPARPPSRARRRPGGARRNPSTTPGVCPVIRRATAGLAPAALILGLPRRRRWPGPGPGRAGPRRLMDSHSRSVPRSRPEPQPAIRRLRSRSRLRIWSSCGSRCSIPTRRTPDRSGARAPARPEPRQPAGAGLPDLQRSPSSDGAAPGNPGLTLAVDPALPASPAGRE